jgi:N-acyl-L-homoserine lactone synthetase
MVRRAEDPKRIDHLAKQALEALAPLSFAVAGTPQEIDSVLRMRFACVIEMGWAQPEEYPDGRERDEYDDGAVFVVCHAAGAIIASARLVAPVLGELLPCEREFRIRVEPPGRPVEVGRVIVPRVYRGGQSHLILAGLFARCWLVARELGYDRVVSTASAPLLELYRGLGLSVTVLGGPKLSWGEERSLIELAATETSLAPLVRAAGVDPLRLSNRAAAP